MRVYSMCTALYEHMTARLAQTLVRTCGRIALRIKGGEASHRRAPLVGGKPVLLAPPLGLRHTGTLTWVNCVLLILSIELIKFPHW